MMDQEITAGVFGRNRVLNGRSLGVTLALLIALALATTAEFAQSRVALESIEGRLALWDFEQLDAVTYDRWTSLGSAFDQALAAGARGQLLTMTRSRPVSTAAGPALAAGPTSL